MAPPRAGDGGDTLLKLNASTLKLADYYTPSDVLSFSNNTGRCANDEDFDSGGALLVPDPIGSNSLVVMADKESKIYVMQQGNLGQFNASGANNLETVKTPAILDAFQGYWGSPAYWHYKDQNNADHYMLYYVATTQTAGAAPYPVNAYQLATSGPPISATPTASSTSLYCFQSPTPSVSSNGTSYTTGIVWATERQYANNTGNLAACSGLEGPAALHALSAFPGGTNGTTLTELYSSGQQVQTTQIGSFKAFVPPTIFKGQVYMATQSEIDVFGSCVNGIGGKCLK